jgi:lipopolysaccharide exporter
VRNIWIVKSLPPRDWLKPHSLDMGLFRRLAGYGAGLYFAGLAGFASRRWDNLVMSGLFGPAVLGQYNLAYNLADVPATQVGEQITDVMLASFPRIDPDKRHNALLRATRILALLILPLAIGLGVVAPTLTAIFTNEKWAGVGPFLFVLSALSIGRPPSGAVGAYAQTRNRPWTIAFIEWGTLLVLLPSMFLLGHIGPLWAAGAVGVAFFARYVAYLVWVRAMDGFPVWPFLRDMIPPIAASATMALVIVLLRPLLRQTPIGRRQVGLLLLEIAIGVVVYVPAALLIARAATRDLLTMAKSLLARRSRTATPGPTV